MVVLFIYSLIGHLYFIVNSLLLILDVSGMECCSLMDTDSSKRMVGLFIRELLHTMPLKIHTLHLKVHTMYLTIHTLRLKIHTMRLKIHTMRLKIYTMFLKIHTMRLKIHIMF